MENENRKIKVLYLIRSLQIGGAERQLTELVRKMDKSRFEIVVVTFYAGGDFRPLIESLPGVKIFSLDKKNRWDVFVFLRKLFVLVHRERPDIIHGYMDVSNMMALFSGKWEGARILWGQFSSNVNWKLTDWLTRLIFRSGVVCSSLVDGVMVNSNSGRDYYVRMGYPPDKMIVIYNGVDTSEFCPDSMERKRKRKEWGVKDSDVLIGLVGRLHPVKDHPSFLKAASDLYRQYPQARFVCVGDGTASYRDELKLQSQALRLNKLLVWTGMQTDMPAVFNALDILVLSSQREGLPNVVEEAMSCQIPCVVTDVGDAARLVGESGIVVKPNDSALLVAGLKQLLDISPERRHEMGVCARKRVETFYNAGQMVQNTETMIMQVCRRKEKLA
jgi:glycosyltransferase involved in cell wall biosynthesis